MSRLKVLVLLAAIAAVALPQTKILLYDFEARGVDASVIRTTTQLLRDAFNGSYKYIVVDPEPGTYCYNVVAAAESARAHGADQALIGNVMTIAGKQLLTYQLVDATSSAVLLADRLDLPPMDEFPTMADRIVASVVGRKPYAETVEPENVLAPEVAPKFKHPRKPYAGVFLTAGYDYLFRDRPYWGERPDTLSRRLVNLNLAVSFETEHMLTMLQMGLMRGEHDESDITFDMLGNYVIGNGDFAPFVGGGIGIDRYNFTSYGVSDQNDAMELDAGGGVLGLRTYYFRLFLAAYGNAAIAANHWGVVPGVRVMFGVSTPSLGPDATMKMSPGCVGAAIGGFFLTGLIIALAS